MRLKSTIILLFFIPALFAQRNMDIIKRRSSFTYSKYNLYAFCDLVRFAGVGTEYRVNLFYGIDLKVGMIYPNGIFKTGVSANDYFDMTGVGAMITPRLYVGPKKIFYFGISGAFYAYGYKNKWENKGIDVSTFSINNGELREGTPLLLLSAQRWVLL